jgi:hypothetical protein
MSSETQLDPKSQRHLDAYLDSVLGALERAGRRCDRPHRICRQTAGSPFDGSRGM